MNRWMVQVHRRPLRGNSTVATDVLPHREQLGATGNQTPPQRVQRDARSAGCSQGHANRFGSIALLFCSTVMAIPARPATLRPVVI